MTIESMLSDVWATFVGYLPKIAGAIIVLIIGWILGRLIGKGISKILDKVGVDDALRKTAIGKAIEKSGMSVVRFFDLLVRYFIYLIAVFAAVDILEVEVVTQFMVRVVEYLPSFIAGVFVLIFGFILADWLADGLSAIGTEAKVEYSRLVSTAIRFFLYFVVIIIALQLMKINIEILYIFATALAWGSAAGIAVGLGIAFGWGLKGEIAKNAPRWFKTFEKSAKGYEKESAHRAERE